MSINEHRASFAAISVSMFIIAQASLVVLGIGAEIADAVGLPRGSAGLLVTAFALPYAFLAPVFQFFFGDRLGSRTLIAVGGFAVGVGLLLTGVADNSTTIFAARGLTAAGAALVTPAALAAAIQLSRPEERGRAISIVFLGFTVASVVGIPLGTQISLMAGWRFTFYLFSAAAVMTSLLVIAVLPTLEPPGSPSLRKSLSLLRNRPLMATLGSATFQLAAQFALLAAMAPILVHHFELTEAYLPAALLAFGIAGVVGNHVAGIWSDRSSLRAPIGFSMAGLLLTFFALSFHVHAYLAVFLFASIAFFGTLFRPPQIVLLTRIADQEDRGLVLGFNTSASYIGLTLGSFASALAVDFFGYASLSPIGIGLLLTAVLPLLAIGSAPFAKASADHNPP